MFLLSNINLGPIDDNEKTGGEISQKNATEATGSILRVLPKEPCTDHVYVRVRRQSILKGRFPKKAAKETKRFFFTVKVF